MLPPSAATAARVFTSHKPRNVRMMVKSFNIRTRPRLLLAIFVLFVFVFGVISGPPYHRHVPSSAQVAPAQPLLSSSTSSSSSSLSLSQSLHPSLSSPAALNVIVIASTIHTAADAEITLQSLNSLHPIPIIHLHHYARAPDSDFAHLTPNYTHRSSRRPYDDPLLAITPTSPPTLLVVAGSQLAPLALHWLIAAHKLYSGRPDVAAFVLDAVQPLQKATLSKPDHEPSSWTSVKLPTSAAFLFRACPRATAIMPNTIAPHIHPWPTFSEWLTLRRSDWYRYPFGPGIDQTPFGISTLPNRNWTRASWNVWFSKFLHEYQLSSVHPNLDGALVVNDGVKYDGAFEAAQKVMYQGADSWNFDGAARPVVGTGQLAAKSYFSDDTIQKLVDLGRQQDGVITFTMVNKVFINTTRSWLCNVDGGGFRPKGLLWAVTDRETNEALSGVTGTTTMWLNEVQGGKETGSNFGNPGYWKLMLERTALITEILMHGIAVFAFETDAVWLEDPSPYIEELVSQDADIVGTINTRMEVSGNFFYLRPSLATRRLWQEITFQFTKAYEQQHFEKKAADSWTYIENDQSQLTKLVLRNETWRKSYPLSFLTLDMEKFADGRWYAPEEGFYASKRARKPVVINNNFVIGVKEKTERAKKFGQWFWDEEQKKCLTDVVNKAVRKR